MTRFLAVTALGAACVVAETAAPLRIKVASSAKLSVSAKAIDSIVDKVTAYVSQGMGSRSSFLKGAKDNQVKDGLFLSQPLRADEQLKVNVIEREPSFGGARAVAAASRANGYMGRFYQDLAKLRSSFLKFSDISTRSAAPVEVINFALEQGVPDQIYARRAAEQKNAEAARVAALARRRIAAESALDSLLASESNHAAQMGDLLG